MIETKSHPWIPSLTEESVKKMLEVIGVGSVSELFKDIPSEILLGEDSWNKLEIGLGRPLSEIEVKELVEEKLSRNKVFNPPPFMGGGVYPHYVPPVVRYIISRGEFLTAYTPYQAEISQGLMQALFEYQSMMAELLEMDIVNASMYDWASSIAEAALMAFRVRKGRRKILLPGNMNPLHRRVVETYVKPQGLMIETIPFDRELGTVDAEAVKSMVDGDTAAVYVQYPNFFGIIEDNVKAIGEIAHEKGALFITGVYPVALGLLKPPGELGADIAVGDGQSLGLGMNYGGPHLGIFAVRYDMNLVRQMPGRIIGLTTTIDGSSKAFAMVWQAREQHIRREKATSNICTNEALMAVASAVYMALLGKTGLRRLAELVYYRAHYASSRMSDIGLTRVFKGEFFNEFPVSFNNIGVKYSAVHEKLLEHGIHGGLYIGSYYPELGEVALYAFTELHSVKAIDRLIETLKKAIEEVRGR
ncbi:aminomethyl-transferring glycine dehydrogenase subunit GcvPA [Desulfurococcus mucosus]|uniref:Probable glycine dehydrogenase (decarboxylating) subunit 1 n=1 Tax=Desulfurococcus mucosus (strain ATCC 35584 / DSM 2162 / JCM 9187 / O7/1) TaxID=765177 RepID=E8R910_DESM0|nr:aminomethyl-transferring glycine dehydrogenase subunit GcvPA [Desulfurococcus mucosus]ADV64986.1 glycine dehydrogenase (decarboxylating) alpha subunit [Desulfurococcus mucosus DSM 2162]